MNDISIKLDENNKKVFWHEPSGFYAKIILDSIAPHRRRLTSVEARYWRMIHSEIMTHRDRARGAASSRAIPFLRSKDGIRVKNCTYSFINDSPFFPQFIGSEQKGMQSGGELTEPQRSQALKIIDAMRQNNLDACHQLYDLGVHKSIINRYVEPWSYITILMTASRWKNFFRLRIHPKAEKHFNLIATMIKMAIDDSKPKELAVGDWHCPYIRPDEEQEINVSPLIQAEYGSPIEIKKRISAGRCARLSYLTQDGIRNPDEDIRVFKTLIEPPKIEDRDDDVIHAGALEHVAEAMEDGNYKSGPFVGWKQFRKTFANEDVEG